jgi:alpha-1,2-mannosyltransferase
VKTSVNEAGAWVPDGRLASAAAWLTPRRLRAQAVVLAICLWGVCAIDYSPPGLFDRWGNIKFQDFLQFPVAAKLIALGRSSELYDDRPLAEGIRAIVGRDTNVYLQYFYGPQVALPFVPFVNVSFFTQAEIWVTLSLLIYFGCVYLLWRRCSGLRPYPGFVFLGALAYPPLFHFFVRGQLSAVVLACFTAACLAFLADRDWLAGIALGVLAFKPQFLVAIPLILLLGQAWRVFAGLALSAGTQLAFASLYFGPQVMRSYLKMLLHSAGQPGTTELIFSPTQMHSLYSYWELLIPWPRAVWALYILTSLAVMATAAAVWKPSSSPALRISALILAAVLVNPHIYIYDLLALVPVFLLVGDWILRDQNADSPAMRLFLYLAFILPLLGPLSRWTHLQLSVPAYFVLLWMLWRHASKTDGNSDATPGHTLASRDSRVV